ncbi:2-dehydro-3-deoxy-6-phosphogalactonate aldolase [uncultured Jannaschia sp.]|uniref:2-dehydro-3-deoxy-6-phosphogalactonate aldolase n=1 Tax=uncultured Jannaschia sp. TaxID=293347 RepID=UPI0026370572|nr:2-dehydro-3-deoxy-6-phosphogalactonate aldolase [uncultured Jannaschia sp.]
MNSTEFQSAFQDLPLVAILRSVTPDEVNAIGEVLVEEGFRLIEVPLISPDPFTSIERLARHFGDRVLVGAGTVRTEAQLDQLRDAGGSLMVTPHGDTALIAAAKRRGLIAMPGETTPTEDFAVLDAGADALKIFPAEAVPPAILRAWRTVFPPELPLCPTGGVEPEGIAPYVAAGAGGFGLGSGLYKPGFSAAERQSLCPSLAGREVSEDEFKPLRLMNGLYLEIERACHHGTSALDELPA